MHRDRRLMEARRILGEEDGAGADTRRTIRNSATPPDHNFSDLDKLPPPLECCEPRLKRNEQWGCLMARRFFVQWLAALVVMPVLLAGPPAIASNPVRLCLGKEATIVGSPGEFVEGTEDPDVVLTNGAYAADTL